MMADTRIIRDANHPRAAMAPERRTPPHAFRNPDARDHVPQMQPPSRRPALEYR